MKMECELKDMKQRFDDELSKIRINAAKNSTFLTDSIYQKLINDVKQAKIASKKVPRDYWLLNRYDVIIVESKNKLIYPTKEGVNNIRYYIADSELFHVLHAAHLAINHGGRDRMLKELSTKYKNITRHDIELYIHLCESCQKKRKGINKDVVKLTFFSEFNSLCQVDIIDFQSQPDREYKFIMVYQDHLTKFMVLKSLLSKRAEEVVCNLVDIFSMLGAPTALQSDNAREFANVVACLKEFWPTLKFLHGKACHSESQVSVKIANQDIKNMLFAWMKDNKSDRWSEGLHIVQFVKNTSYHSGIGRTPYEAVFGCKPKLGLTMSFLTKDMLKDINAKEQVKTVIENIQAMKKGETIARKRAKQHG